MKFKQPITSSTIAIIAITSSVVPMSLLLSHLWSAGLTQGYANIQAASLYLATLAICLATLGLVQKDIKPHTLALCTWAAYYFERTHFMDEVLPSLMNMSSPIPYWMQASGAMHILAASSVLLVSLWRLAFKRQDQGAFMRYSSALLAICTCTLAIFMASEAGVRQLASDAQRGVLNITIDAPASYRKAVCQKLNLTCAEVHFDGKSEQFIAENPLVALAINAAADSPEKTGTLSNEEGNNIKFKKNPDGSIVVILGEQITKEQIQKWITLNNALLLLTLMMSTLSTGWLYIIEKKARKKMSVEFDKKIDDLVEKRGYEFTQG